MAMPRGYLLVRHLPSSRDRPPRQVGVATGQRGDLVPVHEIGTREDSGPLIRRLIPTPNEVNKRPAIPRLEPSPEQLRPWPVCCAVIWNYRFPPRIGPGDGIRGGLSLGRSQCIFDEL